MLSSTTTPTISMSPETLRRLNAAADACGLTPPELWEVLQIDKLLASAFDLDEVLNAVPKNRRREKPQD